VDRRLAALEKDASEITPVEGRIKVVDMAPSIVASAPAGNREAASKVNI
jgi:hypothetical protein